jgi:hypothetical protein
MYIMASEPISTPYFINSSHQSVPLVARHWLGKDVTELTITHVTVEELLDALFSMRSVTYQGR